MNIFNESNIDDIYEHIIYTKPSSLSPSHIPHTTYKIEIEIRYDAIYIYIYMK